LLHLAREPLAHFVLIGAVLFLAVRAHEARNAARHIDITPAHVSELARQYALQFGEPPTKDALEQLVQQDIHDEILFREGLALKLDQGDEIVRRRVVQKEQFLIQSLDPPKEPDAAQLQAYYAAHADRYATPPRTSFSHIFFSAEGGDAAAFARARATLARLRTTAPAPRRDPDLGDVFPDLYDFSNYDPDQVARLFGRTAFSSAVFTAPVGRWTGPVRSAFGWHLLYVDSRSAPRRPAAWEIADRLRSDYLQSLVEEGNRRAFDSLARRFDVVRRDRQVPR
jgi:parvulin-like peptidyl-prolyl isomerase